MKTLRKEMAAALIAWGLAGEIPGYAQAGAPNAHDLDTAINTGDFSGYFANVTAWLNEKTPAPASAITDAALKQLLKDPAVVSALDQRHLLSRTGVAEMGAFAKADPSNRAFLAWLLRHTQAMDLYLEGGTPDGKKHVESLGVWKKIFSADPDSRQGLYLRLAIATALERTSPGSSFGNNEPIDALNRYKHFKSAHANHELFPIFDTLSVWEYRKVVDSQASDSDLAWARQMTATFRPDLVKGQRPVRMVSEVQYTTPNYGPTPYGFAKVLEVGGKCGPRAWFGRMICQAFGIPAVRATQPGHAAVGMKRPWDNQWVVVYGRGWDVTRTNGGQKGPDFIEEANDRSHAAAFSQIEHLKWLASALSSKEQAGAVMGVAREIQRQLPKAKAAAAELQSEAQSDGDSGPPPAEASKAHSQSARMPEAPFKAAPGVTHVEAEACSSKSEALIVDCLTGGKQVFIQKRLKNSWLDYTLDVPAAGTYEIAIHVATPYSKQVVEIRSGTGTDALATILLPNTLGLWQTTPAVEIKLDKGIQKIRLFAPFQRGLAIRWFELKPKR